MMNFLSKGKNCEGKEKLREKERDYNLGWNGEFAGE